MFRYARFRRLLWITTIATTCLLPGILLAAAPAAVPAFSATYTVRYGVLRGTMTLELERRDEGYSYQTSLRPRGFASWLRKGEIRETTSLVSLDGLVRPLDYASVDTIARPHRHANYLFDQPPGHVTGEYKTQKVDVPMRTGGHNRISVQVAIMSALQSNIELSEFPVFDRSRWRDFRFEIIRDQFAETPSGDFETVEVRYSSANSKKSWSLHCAAALNYLPVMIVFREDGKTKSRAVLTEYRIGD
ncbi:MAG: DUF3108 domain-containing protein [Gammaproteobacteria bacterium]|nr:DUF3108 domain-containing protein [Gammaproteobacteria bacterium]